MTFNEYCAYCRQQQEEYLKEERARMRKARALWDSYKAAMGILNLHPLTGTEIENRDRELDRMHTELLTKFGDTPMMRAGYRLHYDYQGNRRERNE